MSRILEVLLPVLRREELSKREVEGSVQKAETSTSLSFVGGFPKSKKSGAVISVITVHKSTQSHSPEEITRLSTSKFCVNQSWMRVIWSFPLTSAENRSMGFEIILFSCPFSCPAEYFCFIKGFNETHEDLCVGLFACADLLGWGGYYLHLITQHANTTIYTIFQKELEATSTLCFTSIYPL